ncbi:hypothetical protein PROFUN_00425 [Planoprotostelium fungivorum]|uniref:T-cell immunomodulatory protein TIP C2 domain-containing protein n=1 Tax=Planoprotostelium fungivorum TaxID=1890364 RepID=A0A2P6N0U4_9EUKA|nr:hypothetical protein PROFUN_00425 [Planoprotostelium fungivorum]
MFRSKRSRAALAVGLFISSVAIYMLLRTKTIKMDTSSTSNLFSPNPSNEPHFRESKLFDLKNIDMGINRERTSFSRIASLGDFNSDRFTDVIMLTGGSSDSNAWKFMSTNVRVKATKGDNIITADFNFDGSLDVLIVGDRETGKELELWYGDHNRLVLSDIKFGTADGDILVLDVNGDARPDLFGEHEGQMTFWINEGDSFRKEKQQRDGELGGRRLYTPHSNSFVDLNGDCLSDLVITSVDASNVRYVEIWLNVKDGFRHHQSIQIPKGTGQLTFTDLDGSGSIDILYPVCEAWPHCTRSEIHVVYNQQISLCKNDWIAEDNCRKTSNLCSADPNFKLNFPPVKSQPDSDLFEGYNVYSIEHYLLVDERSNTLYIRAGDVDRDGYPDLLVPYRSDEGEKKVQLLMNLPCEVKVIERGRTEGEKGKGCGGRSFAPLGTTSGDLSLFEDVHTAAFLDLDEKGKLDIIVMHGNKERVSLVYNNLVNDAFFLKTMALNGLCVGWCGSGSSMTFTTPKPYGVNQYGASFKYTISDIHGNQKAIQGAQLTQSGHNSLSLPYILFGLGRTSNYIEQVYAGLPIAKAVHYSMWICIIPNSQLVAVPFPLDSPDEWQLDLYIKHSGLLLWVVVTVITTLIVIAATIIFFRWREKVMTARRIQVDLLQVEDERIKKETAHLFSFNAM